MPPTIQRQLEETIRPIRLAEAQDALFVRHLQKIHSNAIGFISNEATAWYIDNARCRIALENEEPAGMLLGRAAFRWNVALRPITQAAVDFSAQRRHIGLQLVEAEAIDAREAGQVALQACCREGLEANAFWQAAGFVEVCRLQPSSSRGRVVICWRKSLLPLFTPAWFLIPPPVSGYRAKRTRTE
jgi:N-acetylglutamate synthase-like GNAT family acetyltransferase